MENKGEERKHLMSQTWPGGPRHAFNRRRREGERGREGEKERSGEGEKWREVERSGENERNRTNRDLLQMYVVAAGDSHSHEANHMISCGSDVLRCYCEVLLHAYFERGRGRSPGRPIPMFPQCSLPPVVLTEIVIYPALAMILLEHLLLGGDQKLGTEGTAKKLRDKDFAELSGAICPKALVLLGSDLLIPSNCSEKSLVLFVRFFAFVTPFWLLKMSEAFRRVLFLQKCMPRLCPDIDLLM